MTDRPRRANAGSRMTKLIEEAQDEEEGDDFYKNTYGGFNEDEEDQDYVSEDEQEDIIDSDFSLSEHEDEVENNEDDDDKKRRKPKKKIKTFKKPTTADGAPKVKKPSVKRVVEPVQPLDKQARMRSTTLLKGAEQARKQNVQGAGGIKRHPRMPQMRRLTQEELLAEAKITEEKNTASLAQFLKLEEEKKNVKVTKTRYQGPIIRFQSVRMPEMVEIMADDDDVITENNEQFSCRNFLEFTDTKSFPRKYFPYPSKVKYPEKQVCVVTGRPAKYKDPVTGLPYATIDAFKYIRQHQKKLQEKLSKQRLEGRARRRKKMISVF